VDAHLFLLREVLQFLRLSGRVLLIPRDSIHGWHMRKKSSPGDVFGPDCSWITTHRKLTSQKSHSGKLGSSAYRALAPWADTNS